MRSTEVFSYNLPEERIAQRPIHPYHAAKMMVIDRSTSEISSSTFLNLPEYLNSGDLLIFNNTKVIPARLFGKLSETGAAIEILLVTQEAPDRWSCLGKPLKKLKRGGKIEFASDLSGEVEAPLHEGMATIRFIAAKGEVRQKIFEAGCMPIPPYIRGGVGDSEDRADYQTHFAKNEGSVAAPTASLHFTPELMKALAKKGVEHEFLTLHVGSASFQPLWNSDSQELARTPARESCLYLPSVLERIEETRTRGNKVYAVGTTVVRALESISTPEIIEGKSPGEWVETTLFIKPGYKPKAFDGLITNFHQPRTTHLLLCEAVMGRELLEKSYAEALKSGYRFLSYGDGQLIK